MPVEKHTARLRREYESLCERRKWCEDNGLDFGDDNREARRTAGDAMNAHEVRRAQRRRFGRSLVFKRWARLRGFNVEVVSGVIAPLHIDYNPGETPLPIVVTMGHHIEGGFFASFAREPLIGKPKHIVGVVVATREEAVRFVAAALGVLS
jgi:hypothetical protein